MKKAGHSSATVLSDFLEMQYSTRAVKHCLLVCAFVLRNKNADCSVLNLFKLLTARKAGDGCRQRELKTDDQTYGGTSAN
jgi:hypothetical protein